MSPAGPDSDSAARSADRARLTLVTSNRLDLLVDHLAEDFAADPLPPLEQEIIVVQSQGMKRWLTLELARRQGIAASFTTPFPRPYSLALAERLLDDEAGSEAGGGATEAGAGKVSLFGQDRLQWRLFSALGRLTGLSLPDSAASASGGNISVGNTSTAAPAHPAFDVPAAYLHGDRDQRKRFQLATRLAALYEGYQFFRPDLLAAWADGHDGPRAPRSDSSPVAPASEDARSTAAWQARLWRHLLDTATATEARWLERQHRGELGGRPLAEPLDRRLGRLISLLREADAAPEGLPRRLSVLGVASLPPIFVDLLAAMARFVPVGIYFVSPTYHYWGDLRSEREQARLARRSARLRARGRVGRALRPGASAGDVPTSEPVGSGPISHHFEEGHPLLAALGRQGREFFELLQACDPTGAAWQELAFVDPLERESSALSPSEPDAPSSMPALAVLQSDILHLRTRGPDERVPLAADDVSIEIHACHSPMREMEVLRDRLLDAFERDPELRPSDILVLMPDIELYGPYIQAVFGVSRAGSPHLPFSIADRRAGRERPPSETFLRVLELVGSRLGLRQVFDLLDVPAVRRRFGLRSEALGALRRRMAEAGVRWAMDGEQKARDFGLPADEPNTWRHGLDRLLIGYATGSTDALVAGVLPYSGDTAGPADELGRFATYAETLFAHLRELERPRDLPAWADALSRTIEALFEAEDEAEERGLQWVRDVVHGLRTVASDLSFEEEVSTRVIQEHLRRSLEVEGFGSGFFGGTITFCALRPMRTIPFRLISICGLDDGAFPRQDRKRSFDLMAHFPRPGDRSLREDDRYLFLETLLAAEKRLILSYIGRSQRDASHKEPSAVLAELLDQLDRTFVVPARHTETGADEHSTAARERLRIEHRLQPWNPAYFDAEGSTPTTRPPTERSLPASYSFDDARGAEALLGPSTPVPPFVAAPLADAMGEQQEETLAIDIGDLARFWLLPARFFCQHRLQIELERRLDEIPEHEPFAIEGLDSYRWRQWLLSRRLEERLLVGGGAAGPNGRESEELASMRAAGGLPGGPIGEHTYRRLARRVDAFVERLPDFSPEPARPIAIRGPETETGSVRWQLVGDLDAQTRQGPLHFRCASLRPTDRLRAWIEHLAAVADARQHDQRPKECRLIGEDGAVRFAVPDDPIGLLDLLVSGFRQGLARPLPVFPNASFAYAERYLASLDPRSRARTPPIEAARRQFLPGFTFGPRLPSDSEDPWVELAFRGLDPLEDPDFAELALGLWRPLLDHLEDDEPPASTSRSGQWRARP